MTTPPPNIPIQDMSREEAITHLLGLATMIGRNAFVEEFSQEARGGRPATLIGLEVKDKEAGLLLLANLTAAAQHIAMLEPIEERSHCD